MTAPSLRLRAPAKINWSLEVLGKRADGYHEVRTVLQTIDLSDQLTIEHDEDGLSLALTGDAGALGREPVDDNLALAAARRLRAAAGVTAGARLRLEKRIPVAAGLGGGSSDAAAALRGLRRLWQLSLDDDALAGIAAELGSDVPFFLRGGAAVASGRGDVIDPLPDGPPQRLLVAWPDGTRPLDKTRRMYAALRPEHHTDGARTDRLANHLRSRRPVRDADLGNVFESVLAEIDPGAAAAFDRAAALGIGRPHLCGAGPAFFFLPGDGAPPDDGRRRLEALGLRSAIVATLDAAGALA